MFEYAYGHREVCINTYLCKSNVIGDTRLQEEWIQEKGKFAIEQSKREDKRKEERIKSSRNNWINIKKDNFVGIEFEDAY